MEKTWTTDHFTSWNDFIQKVTKKVIFVRLTNGFYVKADRTWLKKMEKQMKKQYVKFEGSVSFPPDHPSAHVNFSQPQSR